MVLKRLKGIIKYNSKTLCVNSLFYVALVWDKFWEVNTKIVNFNMVYFDGVFILTSNVFGTSICKIWKGKCNDRRRSEVDFKVI